jgi:nitroreductase
LNKPWKHSQKSGQLHGRNNGKSAKEQKENRMLTENIFNKLVEAATLASSADNMQPWEFKKAGDAIEVFPVKVRFLPTDVIGMFGWVGLGAGIQNLVIAAKKYGLDAAVRYGSADEIDTMAAVITFTEGSADTQFADLIPERKTNRSPFVPVPLSAQETILLSRAAADIKAGIHWTTNPSDFQRLSKLDAKSTFIRLEHKPLHDELFDILRFSKKDIAEKPYGLYFESLEVPRFAGLFARLLKFWIFNRLVSLLGIERLVAKQLASRLPQSGALCLVTAKTRDPIGYMEAGRAVEQLWLAATADGLSVHPYGVHPQFLTKVELEPETFGPKYAPIIEAHREPFFSIFPNARNEFPALVLRIGKSKKQSSRSDFRLGQGQIIRKE